MSKNSEHWRHIYETTHSKYEGGYAYTAMGDQSLDTKDLVTGAMGIQFDMGFDWDPNPDWFQGCLAARLLENPPKSVVD